MAGWIRKNAGSALLAIGMTCGVSTGAAMMRAHEQGERTATITYGQLQDIVASDNPVITHLDISLMRGKPDVEALVRLALGDDADFSGRPPRYPVLFDGILRDQVSLHYDEARQDECTNGLCYPPPSSVEALIALAARITDSNLRYDYESNFIHHTGQAFDNGHILRGIVEFAVRSAEAGIEYARLSRMAPDEILTSGKGMCGQYADVFNATLQRLNELFGSPYDLSVGSILSSPDDPGSNAFYEGLSRILNLFYFFRDSENPPHISNIVIAHDPHRLSDPVLYFVDAQQIDPFVVDDQVISVDRGLFERYDAALTLAEEHSVRAYARRHGFDPRVALWDHIVIDDGSARILVDDLGLREDVVSYIRNNTEPTILALSEIGALRRYDGEANGEGIIDFFNAEGWLVSRLREHRARQLHVKQGSSRRERRPSMSEDAGALVQEGVR